MADTARAIVKTMVPKFIRYHSKNIYRNLRTRKARQAFDSAPSEPAWLNGDVLPELQAQYATPPLISYAPKALESAGERRADAIFQLLGSKTGKINRFLDLGCSEGMVCAALNRRGKSAVGIDIRYGFDQGIAARGVSFLQMNAGQLAFGEGSFDFVFSLAAFEHFDNPEGVLEEAIRVTGIGGYIYLHYGPLYLSHYGLHAYRSLTIPYCQCLFKKEDLIDFCNEKNLKPPDYASLNQWKLGDFRKLWDNFTDRVRRIKYYEYINTDYVDLIARYPSCFRSKSEDFNDFIVPEIEVLFQKIR